MSGDFYIKFDGVDGESSDSKHQGWIELGVLSHNIQLPFSNSSYSSTGGGTNAGRADFGFFDCVKSVDKSSVKIMEKCGTGFTIPTAEIHCCQAGDGTEKHTYLTYKLKDVIITSYSINASQHDDARPQETMSVAYGNIEVGYKDLTDAGKAGAEVKFQYSLKENKKV